MGNLTEDQKLRKEFLEQLTKEAILGIVLPKINHIVDENKRLIMENKLLNAKIEGMELVVKLLKEQNKE